MAPFALAAAARDLIFAGSHQVHATRFVNPLDFRRSRLGYLLSAEYCQSKRVTSLGRAARSRLASAALGAVPKLGAHSLGCSSISPQSQVSRPALRKDDCQSFTASVNSETKSLPLVMYGNRPRIVTSSKPMWNADPGTAFAASSIIPRTKSTPCLFEKFRAYGVSGSSVN